MSAKAMSIFIIGLFLIPFGVLIGHVGSISVVDFSEWGESLLYTSVMSFLSGVGSIIFGCAGAYGLLSVKGAKKKTAWTVMALVPNMVPPLLIISALISLATFLEMSSVGFWWIVFAHVVINSGVVAVYLKDLFVERLSGPAELCFLEGASRWTFWVHGVLRGLKTELYLVFLFVFTICFNSFSIPMVLGDVNKPVFEMLIYQKVKQTELWGQALMLCLIQIVLFFILSSIKKPKVTDSDHHRVNLKLFEWWPGLLVLIMFCLLTVALNFTGILKGAKGVLEQSFLLELAIKAGAGSLLVGFFTGAIVLVLLLGMGWVFPSRITQRFLLSYSAPSGALLGFSLMLIPFGDASNKALLLVKLSVGLAVMFFPFCYRFRGESELARLMDQIQTARTLGARRLLIFTKVIWPQVRRPYCWLAGMCAFWACGEFAISSMVLPQDLTLGLVVKNLLGSYRLAEGSFLVWPMIAVGLFCWAIFWGVGRVDDIES